MGKHPVSIVGYRILRRWKKPLSALLDSLSPGLGLRKRFKFLDRFMKKLETPLSIAPLESLRASRGERFAAKVQSGSFTFKLYLSTREPVSTSPLTRDLLIDRLWEPLVTKLISQLLRPGDVVLDIGANIGYYSVLAGKIVGKRGRVFAFEPDPYTYGKLCQNVRINRLQDVVKPLEKAVGERTSRSRLFLSGADSGDHRLFDSGEHRGSVEVACVRLDEYAMDIPQLREQLALVKMDVQGFEVAAYRGMRELLTHSSPALITEYEPCTLAAAGSSATAYVELLRSYGYHSFAFISWDRKQQAPLPMAYQELLQRQCASSEHPHGYLYCRKDG